MALDVGERRIGVAISDPARTVASPLQTLPRRGGDADRKAIADLLRQFAVGRLVVGLPLTLLGEEGPQARRIRSFADRLAQAIDRPIELVDERYSTIEASGGFVEGQGGATARRRRRRPDVDSAAAAVILQRYLDSHRGVSS